MTPASCWAIARRLRERFSRSRENRPRPRSSGSGSGASPSPVLNIACHVRVTGAGSVASRRGRRFPSTSLRAALHGPRAARSGLTRRAAAARRDHFLDAELRGAADPRRRADALARRGSRTSSPTARPRRIERSEGLARWDGGGAVGYVALAEALDPEAGDRAGRRAARRRRALLPHRPAGLVRRAGGPARARVPAHGHIHRAGSSIPTAARRCWAPTRSAWRCPGADGPDGRRRLDGAGHLRRRAARRGPGARAARGGRPPADGAAETDPARDRSPTGPGSCRSGAEQAYKGFALAAMVELLCGALAGTDGLRGGRAAGAAAGRAGRAPARARRRAGGSPATAAPRTRAEAVRRGTVDDPRRPVGVARGDRREPRSRQRLRASTTIAGRLDRAAVHAYLTTEYWALGRTRERQDELIEASGHVVGLYHQGRQVGFARAVDCAAARFVYLADVYVLRRAPRPRSRRRARARDRRARPVCRPHLDPAHARRGLAVRAVRLPPLRAADAARRLSLGVARAGCSSTSAGTRRDSTFDSPSPAMVTP